MSVASKLRENSLSLAAFGMFFLSLAGQIGTGLAVYNEDAREHGAAVLGLGAYLGSGHFVEAIFENWESEFLQMALFVVLTKYLRQKGSSESKKLDEPEEVDEDPREHRRDPGAPWPVKKGGMLLALYERSLSSALLLLFALSFVLHAYGGSRQASVEAMRHGGHAVSMLGYMATSQFWFESFQNWQSEFLSVGVLVVFSIFLRERGSSQSKPVARPNAETED